MLLAVQRLSQRLETGAHSLRNGQPLHGESTVRPLGRTDVRELTTTRNWKTRYSGEKMKETEWHQVVLYDRQAEVAGEYLKKGRRHHAPGLSSC